VPVNTYEAASSFQRAPKRTHPGTLWLTTSRLYAGALGQVWWVRIGKWWTFGIGVTAILALLLVQSVEPKLQRATLGEGLLWLSWAQILTGFGCALDRQTLRDLAGLETLGRLRGLRQGSEAQAWLVGALQTLLWPALLAGGALGFAHAALSETLREFFLRSLQLGLILVYFASLSLLLARLSTWLGARAGRHARLLFAGSIFIPHLATWIWPSFPSLPSAFGWFLEHAVLGVGA